MSRPDAASSPSEEVEPVEEDEEKNDAAWVWRYLPRTSLSASLRRAREQQHHAAISPRAEEVRDAAILIADVSGFSAVEAAEERRAGRDGTDRFSETVNAVLGGLEAVVHAGGGEVMHVAGDALICLFHAGQTPAEACAENLQRAFDDIADQVRRDTGLAFSLHGGVGGGGATLLHLGNHSRRQFTVCGRALARAVDLLVGPIAYSHTTSGSFKRRRLNSSAALSFTTSIHTKKTRIPVGFKHLNRERNTHNTRG